MEIKKWGGLRNTDSTERFKAGDLDAGSNVDVSDSGKLLVRDGMTQVSATPAHSLYANDRVTLLMEGASLKTLVGATRTTIATLSTDAPVSYDTYNGVVYASNGVDVFRVVGTRHKPWGVVPPANQPSAVLDTGNLAPGRYLYAMTFLRSDGHESGTGVSGAIDLPLGGGIAFSGMEVSTNIEIDAKILYISSPNGETLYRAAVVLNGQTAASYGGSGEEFGVALTTQHAGPPPPGTMVRSFNGHMYVVQGDTVWFSDPYDLELFRPASSFLRFPGPLAVFESVQGGLFVATVDVLGDDPNTFGATWYLSGMRPDQLASRQVLDYGAVPGTDVKTQAAYFESPREGEVAGEFGGTAVVWTTRHGVVVGFDGGSVKNMTEVRYSFPDAQRGAGMVRQTRGYVQYVVVVRGAGAANNEF